MERLLLGFTLGILATLTGIGLAVIWTAWRLTRSHEPPESTEYEMLLGRYRESVDAYDEMCRDCGGIHGHYAGCPQMEEAR